MKYTTPTYNKETIETEDIILASSGVIDLGNGTSLTETADGNANVLASVLDILGLR